MNHIFPVILMLLDIFASVHYLTQSNYPKSLYWFAAAILTFSIIWSK